MDRSNQHNLTQLAAGEEHLRKLHLLRSFDPASHADPDVPDPYYGEGDGFARVFDICLAGCSGLLAHLRATHACDPHERALAIAIEAASAAQSSTSLASAAVTSTTRAARGLPTGACCSSRRTRARLRACSAVRPKVSAGWRMPVAVAHRAGGRFERR